MIRLKVNAPPHAAGAVVDPGFLDAAFVQALLAAGQAEEVEPVDPTDPVEVVLDEVFELEDQIDSAINRRHRLAMLIDGLDADGKDRVEAAFTTATRFRPELFDADPAAAEEALRIANDLVAAQEQIINADVTEIRRLKVFETELEAARGEIAAGNQRVADLQLQATADAAEIARLNAALTAATAAPTDTPPPPAEASGDADGASASSVDPAAPVTTKPAAKSGGAAKAKAGG